MPTSNEYHEGVEACYRLAGEAKNRDGSLGVTTSTHSYHGYQLVLHHENDDRYRVTIFNSRGNRVASTSTHLERQGALTEASRYVNQLLAKRRAT
jgi:hypothetical protein